MCKRISNSRVIVITMIIQYVSFCFGQENNQPSTEPSETTQPYVLVLPNESFNHPEHSSPGFKCGMDPNVTSSGKPALLLLSTTAAPIADGNAFCRIDVTPFLGKRVRISAMLKSANLANWAGIGMAGIAQNGKWVRFDTLSNQLLNGARNRPLSGTTDWSRVEIVSDIPRDISQLMVGLQMKGSGRVWIDDAKIEVVGNDAPTTDDQKPHLYSDYAPKYSIAIDQATPRDGHPVLCVTPRTPPPGAHCWFGLNDRQPDQYLGHRIRLSAWMKCEGNGRAHLSLVAAMPGRQSDREIDNQAGQPAFPLTGTWRRYEVIGKFPANAQCLTEGDFLWCNGRVWIDDMKVEIIDH
jgi:hypothetical protein